MTATRFPQATMRPTPPEKLKDLGSIEGMPAFSHADRAHSPGARLDMGGELVDYPGSVEHYTPHHWAMPTVAIRPALPVIAGRILDVHYLDKRLTLDTSLPAQVLDGTFFEVGAPERNGPAARWTSFEAVKVEPQGAGRTLLTWRKGAELYSGKIKAIERKGAASASMARGEQMSNQGSCT
jgi:hypothetical protein